jgi:hypothetical protein
VIQEDINGDGRDHDLIMMKHGVLFRWFQLAAKAETYTGLLTLSETQAYSYMHGGLDNGEAYLHTLGKFSSCHQECSQDEVHNARVRHTFWAEAMVKGSN